MPKPPILLALPTLLLATACGGDEGPPTEHLFSRVAMPEPPPEATPEELEALVPVPIDMATWSVAVPRSAPLRAEVQDRLTGLLARDPEQPIKTAEETVWVLNEEIKPWFWNPRGDLNAESEDLRFWEYRPLLAVALPLAKLHHDELEFTVHTGPFSELPAFGYRSYENTVVLALPHGTSQEGFAVDYPTPAPKLFGHLGDLTRAAGEVPVLRRVTMRKQTRSAVMLPPPLALRAPLEVPEGGRIYFGVGLDAAGPALLEDQRLAAAKSESNGAGIRLTVCSPDGTRKVVTERFIKPDEVGRFHDLSADLGAWAGQEIELEFSSYSTANGTSGVESSRRHDFLFLSDPILARKPLPAAKGPNVLIVLLDTLRADALGCYNPEIRHTPVLDQLARDGVLFEQARSSSTWTLPAHSSLFCSLLPAQHGALTLDNTLSTAFPTVAETVREAGWQTFAATDGVIVSPAFGLDRGFDRFDIADFGIKPDSEKMLRWLDQNDGPFFAFLQTYQVHDPYEPEADYRDQHVTKYTGGLPEIVNKWELDQQREKLDGADPTTTDIEYVRALYDAEVAYTDAILGDFFAGLRERGLWENTLIIVTSDHGEEFWEHGGYCHGHTLYEELLRVPMIVHHPRLFHGGERIPQPVRLVDLAPTITEFLGIEKPPGWIGIPLTKPDAPRDILSSITTWEAKRQLRHRIDALVQGPLKWTEAPEGAREADHPFVSELFDLVADPGEQNPLQDEALRAELSAAIKAVLARYPLLEGSSSDEAELTREELDALRGLGYVK